MDQLDAHPFFTDQPLKLEQVLVIIPVLNEAATIASVIQNLQRQGLRHIRVVDNGSDDRSAILAQEQGAEVVLEPQQGYGQACWRGLQAIPPAIEWMLFCDGDGSDDLSQLPHLFAAASSADFVLANRRAEAASRAKLTPAQNFGNVLAVTLIRWGWGHAYQDLGPLRLIRRSSLERLAMKDRAFGWTVEMQVRAIETGLTIVEIPVTYGDRQGGRSKISGTVQGVFRAGKGILGTVGQLYRQRLQRAIGRSLGITTMLAAGLLLLGCLLMQPHGSFDSTPSFYCFSLGTILMLAGFGISGWLPHLSAIWFWSVAILARGLLLPMAPGDDVWRYLWEGYLQTQGFSPYGLPPNAAVLIPLRTDWWPLINHPGTSAIYPPVAQWGFRGLAQIGLSVLVFKLAFVLADLVVCGLLSRRYGYKKALFYAWNPLILYSFAGGAHYDSWFLLPIVAAWLLAEQRQWVASALCLGISIGVKWISLPLLAFLLWQTRWKRAIVLLAVASLPLLLTIPSFCQLGSCALVPVKSSFVEMGRSAEFIPYLFAFVWPASKQFNWIFALPLAASILGMLWFCKRFLTFAETYFFLLLSLSPIIHAWYFTWIIPFGVASQNWGIRLVSASTFIYFLLPYRQFTQGDLSWALTLGERALLWLPLIIGFLGSFSSGIRENLRLDGDNAKSDFPGEFTEPIVKRQ